MKLKYKYTFQEYDDRYLAIIDFTDGAEDKRLLWVNRCGKAIMEFLMEDISRENLINAITEQYSGDKEVIESSVDTFIKQLSEANLLMDS